MVLVGTAFLAFGTVNIASAASTNTIKIHYYSDGYVPYIYYWNSTPNNMEVAWPGKKMSADSSAAESGCYVYEFTGVDKINFLFNNGGAEGEKQTEEINQSEYTKDLELQNGKNNLTVIVYNKNGLVATLTVEYVKE